MVGAIVALAIAQFVIAVELFSDGLASGAGVIFRRARRPSVVVGLRIAAPIVLVS